MIKDNILSTKTDFKGLLPGEQALGIAARAKARRLELNLSQAALAKRSGVSLGTLKHFESKAEISLKSILLLAAAMDSMDGFDNLFIVQKYFSFEEAVESGNYGKRKRGRINE